MGRTTFILFILGFVFLIKGADLLVDGASSLAKKFWISDIIIGLTIVAFGTSAPELVVNINSSLKGITGITIWNILGSNIANILLILGASALIYPIKIAKNTLSREVILSLMAVIIFAIFINDQWIDGISQSLVTRSEGMLLIILLGYYLYYLFIKAIGENTESSEKIQTMKRRKSALWIIFWISGLIIGGEWIVNGAVAIANKIGISDRIIGLTIIAIGTSLPELATSVVAAFKKNTDIALGNVIGSNIFNILFILGISSTIAPIPAATGTNSDLLILIIASILILVFGYGLIGKKQQINKREGLFMILLYFSYLGYLIISSY